MRLRYIWIHSHIFRPAVVLQSASGLSAAFYSRGGRSLLLFGVLLARSGGWDGIIFLGELGSNKFVHEYVLPAKRKKYCEILH